ncbi:sugar phosphate isomerase/epimerase family protein [Roseimarinus sediminis]|uniref:sugar phosphate isomerase/epimerase family protein n=1 Tax=Roseimarinus sediminis TaxID=1610899 RepID=UPI003D1EC4F3
MIRKILPFLLIAVLFIASSSCDEKREVGIQLWSVRKAMQSDAEATITQLGAMGYQFVEAASYNDGKFYGMEPVEFKQMLNGHGLRFLSSHAGHPLPDSANYEEVMAWWEQCIDAHARAGVKYLVQAAMDERGYGSLADLQRYCDYFNEVGAMCNAKGIRFGYHNHTREFETVDGIVRYDYMLQHTDPEKVMFQLDLYWIQEGGKKAADYVEAYPGRFELWHLKDEAELGGSGKMDFEQLMSLADKAGVQHYIVEVEKYNYSPLESVEKSLEYLKNSGLTK